MDIRIKAALCLLLTPILLCSCANVTPIVEESGVSASDNSEIDIPKYDGFGDTVTIATSAPQLFGDGETDFAAVTQAASKRISDISLKYGVKTQIAAYSEGEIVQKAKTALESGEALGDLYCFSRTATGEMALAGALTDLMTLKRFDINAPYVNTADAKSLSAAGKLFMITSPSTLDALDAWCVFYNADVTTAPASLYLNGRWTLDAFMQQCAAQGFVSEGDGLISALWTAANANLLDANWHIPTDLSAQDTAARKLNEVYKLHKDGGKEAFSEGKAAFLCAPLSLVAELADSETNWCVVPMPSASSVSRGMISSSALCFSIPMHAPDVESSTVLLCELLASDAEFKSTAQEAVVLQYSRNNTQTVMLQKVMNSAYTDGAMTFASFDDKFGDALLTSVTESITGESSLSSLLNAKRDAFTEYIAQMYK